MSVRAKGAIGKVIFAAKGFNLKMFQFFIIIFIGMKMGKGAKSAERIIVITDQVLLKIDTRKNKVMEKEPISVVTGISIFDYDNSKTG